MLGVGSTSVADTASELRTSLTEVMMFDVSVGSASGRADPDRREVS